MDDWRELAREYVDMIERQKYPTQSNSKYPLTL
jgi:hypothetical protein